MAEKRKPKRPEPEKVARDGGWEPVEGGKIEGWDAGKIIEGRFVQLKAGNFGPLAVIQTREGTLTIGVPTILKNRLDMVPVGDLVRIECLGSTTTKSGREAWDFAVARKPAATATQSDIPF